MDFDEIQILFDGYAEKEKEEHKKTIASNYNMATMTSSFVSGALNGKKPPSLNDLYPDLFPIDRAQKIKQFEASMLAFANEWNLSRKVKNAQ